MNERDEPLENGEKGLRNYIEKRRAKLAERMRSYDTFKRVLLSGFMIMTSTPFCDEDIGFPAS